MSAFASITGVSPPSYNNGQNTGSLKNNYRVSSITGNMAGNDANDAWDGGMTVNMSPGTGSSNYTVVCSGKAEVGGYNYTSHQDSIPYTRTLVLLHAYSKSSGSFKLKGFGTYMNTDYGVGHWHYSEIHFSVFDTTSGTDQT